MQLLQPASVLLTSTRGVVSKKDNHGCVARENLTLSPITEHVDSD